MEELVKANERLDDLHRNGLMLIQNPEDFCFGIDAVLLSDFAKAKRGEKVVDLCSGTGVIPILMSAKNEAELFVGLEIQQSCAEMAQRSVKYNNLQSKVKIYCGDLRDCKELLPSAEFDVVTANPPYMANGGGIQGGYHPKTMARHEITMSLDDLICTAARLLKFSGRFYMVHRPYRLVDIFVKLREYNLEPKALRLIQPYESSKPNLALIEAVRGGKPMLEVLPALVIYKDDGAYTEEIIKIYYE